MNWNSKTGFIYLSPSVFVCAWSSLQFWSCQLGDSEEEEEDLSKVNTRAEIDLTQLCTLASILDVIFLLQQFLKLLLPTFFTFISKTHRPAAKFWAEINHYNNYYARLLPYLMWYFFCSSLKLLLPTFSLLYFLNFGSKTHRPAAQFLVLKFWAEINHQQPLCTLASILDLIFLLQQFKVVVAYIFYLYILWILDPKLIDRPHNFFFCNFQPNLILQPSFHTWCDISSAVVKSCCCLHFTLLYFLNFGSKTHRLAAQFLVLKFWTKINLPCLFPYLMWYFFCSSLKLLLPTFFT